MTAPRKSSNSIRLTGGCAFIAFAFFIALGSGILGLIGTVIWLILKIGGAL